jgi:two-component system, OmpR family, sensor kinase
MRLKFTLYYLALLTAVLIFFGVAIYAYIARGLVNIIDTSLAASSRSIESRLQLGEMPEHSSPGEEEMMIAPLMFQIINEFGDIIDEQYMMKAYRLPINISELQPFQDNQLHVSTINLASGEQLRIATLRTTDKLKQPMFVRVGQSLRPLQKARRQLLLLLALAGPAALLMGSYGGLLLANQALRPVDRLTRAAKEIEAGDLSKRVHVPSKMDELGRLAITFNRMISRLQAAFERQRQFTADASHELRTPLAVMRGDIEIALRRNRSADEYQEVLASNLEEIIRLSRLVEDLLMLARADAGPADLHFEPMNIGDLCSQVVDYLAPLAEVKNQALAYQSDAKAELTIKGDAQRLKQMLLNLLDNAIKYTPGGGRITLTLMKDSKDAVMIISDTGRGIPTEDIPHIFERFFRHSRSTSDKTVQGSGLGLSIVKWIVESHQGNITAENNSAGGTKFTVRLPLQ